MISIQLQDVQASCVLRACRFKREHLIRDRDAMVDRCDVAPDQVTIQAVEVMNAELSLLDTAVDAIWEKLAGHVVTELNARRHAGKGDPVPGGN